MVASVDRDEVQRALHDHIVGELLLRKTPLAPDEDLQGAGFDSMCLTRVLVFVEDRFGVVIRDEDMGADDFATLGSLSAFVSGRIAAARGQG